MPSRRGSTAGGSRRPATGSLVAALDGAVLLLVSPLLLFPRGFLPLVGLAAIAGLWLFRLISNRRRVFGTPLDLPILIILAMSLQSLYPSTDLSASMPKLYGIVLQIAVYFAVVNSVRSWKPWWGLLTGLSAAAVGVALVGLVSTAWINKLPGIAALYAELPKLITSVQSSSGTIAGIHPNELGGTLAFLLPVAVGVVLWGAGVRGRGTGGSHQSSPPHPSPLTPHPSPFTLHYSVSSSPSPSSRR